MPHGDAPGAPVVACEGGGACATSPSYTTFRDAARARGAPRAGMGRPGRPCITVSTVCSLIGQTRAICTALRAHGARRGRGSRGLHAPGGARARNGPQGRTLSGHLSTPPLAGPRRGPRCHGAAPGIGDPALRGARAPRLGTSGVGE